MIFAIPRSSFFKKIRRAWKLRLIFYFAILISFSFQWHFSLNYHHFSYPRDFSTRPWTDDPWTETLIVASQDLDASDKYFQSLPHWMQAYFQWHSQQISRFDDIDWHHHRVLIVRCIDNDRCGGTSDRLKSVPLFLVLAAKSKRLLFLHWNRPFALEQFLIPRKHWNWTVPSSLASLLLNDNNLLNQTTILSKKSQQLVSTTENPSNWLVQGNLQFSGAALYQNLAGEIDNSTVQDYNLFYHSFFHSSFGPAPAIHKMVDQIFKELHLIPNNFVVAHVRAKYPGEVFRKTGNLSALHGIVDNAICVASTLTKPSSSTIYLASDTLAVLQAGVRSKQRSKNVHVVSRLGDSNHIHQTIAEEKVGDPPHLNFAQRDDPSAFYSIFVDLIIMSQSSCVTFGAGGFGRFGSLVSFNASCRQAHSVKGVMKECTGV